MEDSMDERQRRRDRRPEPAAPGAGGGSDELSRLRRQGEELLSAGDSIIRNTLSGDSEAFLRASRQQGGQ